MDRLKDVLVSIGSILFWVVLVGGLIWWGGSSSDSDNTSSSSTDNYEYQRQLESGRDEAAQQAEEAEARAEEAEAALNEGGYCEDVTSYDYNWDNDMLCTRPDGSQFYTNYAGADAYENQ